MKNALILSENGISYKDYMPAVYLPNTVPYYSGNPLIEALPDIHTPKFMRTLSTVPDINDDILQLPSHLRIHMAASILEECFTVTPQMIALEETVSMMIRHGYMLRNPLHQDNFIKNEAATGLPLCGIHGCGQKSALQRIASTYPKMIQHHEYNGKVTLMIQIPCLQLHLSSTSTLQTVFDNIIDIVSELTGVTPIWGLTTSKEAKGIAVLQLLQMMHVGIILTYGIDTVNSKSELNIILGFFTSLISNASIPVVFVGSPDLAAVFGTSYTFGYPASSAKSIFNFLMDFDSNWITVMHHLWDSMLLKTPIPFTDEIAALLYQHSQGLIGIAKRILEEAEIHALQSGKETFSIEDLAGSAIAALEHLAFQIDELVEGSRLAAEHHLDLAQAHHMSLVSTNADETPATISPSAGSSHDSSSMEDDS